MYSAGGSDLFVHISVSVVVASTKMSTCFHFNVLILQIAKMRLCCVLMEHTLQSVLKWLLCYRYLGYNIPKTTNCCVVGQSSSGCMVCGCGSAGILFVGTQLEGSNGAFGKFLEIESVRF